MKFHKTRTAVQSGIEGLDAYLAEQAAGRLRFVRAVPGEPGAESGIFQVLSIREVHMRDDDSSEPLEVAEVTVQNRELVIDELTRHRATPQVFIPVTGPFLGVACGNDPSSDSPDPRLLRVVPVRPGEAFVVPAAIWHTLPLSVTGEVTGLSVMHRTDLDSYHDVRDLVTLGWVGVPYFGNPSPEEPSAAVLEAHAASKGLTSSAAAW